MRKLLVILFMDGIVAGLSLGRVLAGTRRASDVCTSILASACFALAVISLPMAERERYAKIAESAKKADPENDDTSEYTLGVDTTATWIAMRIRSSE